MRLGSSREQNGTVATYDHVPATISRQLWVFYGNVACCLFMLGCVLFMTFAVAPVMVEVRDSIKENRAEEVDYLKSIKTARQEHLRLEMDLVVLQEQNLKLARALKGDK